MMKLNESQQLAATYDGPEEGILVLAGAGCGKTRTMVARAIFLLGDKQVRPERLGMLTFTKRAAGEIQERLELELPGRHRGVFVGTFHRFCLNLIHRYPEFFDFNELKVMDRSDEEAVLRKIRKELLLSRGYTLKDKGVLPAEGGIAAALSYVNNTCSTLEEYQDKIGWEQETLEMVTLASLEYEKYKKEHGYLDFDDILMVIANKLSESEEFRRRVQWLFEYILVDEMQDTSPVQWKILRALYPAVKLFCVGDDAQSIYGFRGADFDSVHHFCQLLPNSCTLQLTENYRSNQQILDAANVLLDESSLGYGRHLIANQTEHPAKPNILTYYDETDEARSMVNMIAERMAKGVPLSEMLVLMRSVVNGRSLEYELKRYGIPFRMVGGKSFLQSAHVKDVISALEALTDPTNAIAWNHLVTMFPKMGEKSADKIYQQVVGAGIADNHQMLAEMGKALKSKGCMLADFLTERFDSDGTPEEMLKSIVDFFNGTGMMEKKYEHWEERQKDLKLLQHVAGQYEKVSEFLESFKLDPDAEAEEGEKPDVLTLSTVHGAKGTEADVVFVMHVQGGNYPHYRSTEEHEIEEERRILYVAMTRARKELFLTVCQEPMIGFYSPSPFLSQHLLASCRRNKRR